MRLELHYTLVFICITNLELKVVDNHLITQLSFLVNNLKVIEFEKHVTQREKTI